MDRRKIRLKEGNAKCRHLKKLTCAASVYLSKARTPYPPLHTVYVCTLYSILIHTGKGGGGGELEFNQREGLRGNSSQSWIEKI